MRRIIVYIILSLIGLLFLFWLFRTIYNKIELKKEKAVTYILSVEEKSQIKSGDIVLRYGHGLVSDYIVKLFNEEYTISHCGIISKTGNQFDVIHSESSSFLSKEGIQKQDFDSFTDAGHENSVIIVRFNKCDQNDLGKITERANYYLRKNIPFDYSFNTEDTSVMYCSEIIWHIFLDEFNVDIFLKENGERDFKQFKNFWDPNYFDIVLNHQIK